MGAQGTTTVDFGAFPGKSDASVAITGQTAILSGSLVEAWMFPTATVDHSADEHVIEPLEIYAGAVVAGTGFTVYALNRNSISGVDSPRFEAPRGAPDDDNVINVDAPMPYGLFTIAWAWN